MDDTTLKHYGVLGMKWGVKRGNKLAVGSKISKKGGTDNAHEDYKKAHDSKNAKTMSDKELRERLNRLQMEQQYSKLKSSDINRGKQYLDKIVKAGTTVATVTTTGLTIYNNIDKIKSIINKTSGK